MPDFIESGRKVAEMWQFNGFSKWRPSAILDLMDAYLDHMRRILGCVLRWAKFGWNRCISLDSMKLLVWLENAYLRPKNCFFWNITSQIGCVKIGPPVWA